MKLESKYGTMKALPILVTIDEKSPFEDM